MNDTDPFIIVGKPVVLRKKRDEDRYYYFWFEAINIMRGQEDNKEDVYSIKYDDLLDMKSPSHNSHCYSFVFFGSVAKNSPFVIMM